MAFRSRTPQGPRNTLLWPRHGRHRWLSPRRKTTRTPLCLSSLTLRSWARPALPSLGAPQPCPGQGRRSWEPGASSPLECSLSLDPRRSHSGRRVEPESPVTSPRSPGPCPPSGTSPKMEQHLEDCSANPQGRAGRAGNMDGRALWPSVQGPEASAPQPPARGLVAPPDPQMCKPSDFRVLEKLPCLPGS